MPCLAAGQAEYGLRVLDPSLQPVRRAMLTNRMMTEVTLSQIPVWIARFAPLSLKAAIHRVRFLHQGLMTIYGALIADKSMMIEDGPMRGIQLSASRHTSHAHIQGTYEREVQEAIDSMVRPADICYDLGASIGYMT